MEKLDKTLSLLEKLKIEQQMDYLVSRTDELSREAASYADSTAALLGEPRPEGKDTLSGSDSEMAAAPDSSLALSQNDSSAGLKKPEKGVEELKEGQGDSENSSKEQALKAVEIKNLSEERGYLAEKILDLDQQ